MTEIITIFAKKTQKTKLLASLSGAYVPDIITELASPVII